MIVNKSIKKLSKAKILVIGDLILDKYWNGDAKRISPEAPIPVVNIDKTSNVPGGAANVAVNIATLGAKVYLLGITGKDENSKIIKQEITKYNINYFPIEDISITTATKLRIIAESNHIVRADFENPDLIKHQFLDQLKETFKKLLTKVNVVIFSDYQKGCLKQIVELIKLAKEKNIITLLDPKLKDFEQYKGIDVITPNLKEFETVVGKCKNELELEYKAKGLKQKYCFKNLVLTRGGDGVSLFTKATDSPIHMPVVNHEVFDVTGAGDTVIATLGVMLGAGYKIDYSTYIANIAASLVVKKVGTANVKIDELNYWMQTKNNNKVLDPKDLNKCVKMARKIGKKIVLTNGCFDILHPGHINYLQEAKMLGDILIVLINKDDSIRRLKGKNRPINSLEVRLQMLASLIYVDYVSYFEGDDPIKDIKNLKPDILTKGGDYNNTSEIVGSEIVFGYGGNVKILSFSHGFSSTNTINKIKGDYF